MMNNKKVLVTGGAGFIGSNLVKKLLSENNDVIVIDDLSSGFKSNIIENKGIRFINGDIRNRKVIDDAINGVEVVFHLAASVGNKRSIDFPIIDSEINILGTLNILEASIKEGVRKIVTSSSAGIFGELKTIPIKENHQIEPDSPYGCSKLCQEKLCLSYSKLYEQKLFILDILMYMVLIKDLMLMETLFQYLFIRCLTMNLLQYLEMGFRREILFMLMMWYKQI